MKRTSQSRPPRGDDRGPRRGGSTRGPASRGGSTRGPASRSGEERGGYRGGSTRGPGSRSGEERGGYRGGSTRGPASRSGEERGGYRGGSTRGPASRAGETRGPSRGGESRRPASRGGEARRGPRADGRAAPPPRPSARSADPAKILARQPWASLRLLIPGAPGELEQRLEALRAYATQLLEWNRGVSNLVSRHDEPRLVERHLRESLIPARELLEAGYSRMVDFGSGAGLPAVPLALCGVGAHWTLVESRRNKTLFLKKIKQDFKLQDFEVLTGRLEVVVEENVESLACDGFTSRATAAVGPTLELAGRIVRPGGAAFLWKGSSYESEMKTSRESWEGSWRLDRVIPIVDGPNVIAVFIKL